MKTTLMTKMIIFGFALTIAFMLGFSNAGAQCPPCLQLVSCDCSVDSCATPDSDGHFTATAVFRNCEISNTLIVDGFAEVNGSLVGEFSGSVDPQSEFTVQLAYTGPAGDYPTLISGTSTNSVGPTTVECNAPCLIPPCAIEVPIDIKPMACPNPLNVRSRGVLPVAILGTDEFDVTQIDPSSVHLTMDGLAVSPLRWSYEDVATPAEDGCNDYGGDGILDLVLMFDTQEVITELLGDVNDGDVIPLLLMGNLLEDFGGIPVIGEDAVVILNKGM